MAASEQSKSEFTSILSRLGRNFDVIHTKWLDDKNFEAKFRTQIPKDNDDYNGLCDEWVELFSTTTATTWVKKVSNTGPKIKFRKQYQCWTHTGKVQKELLFDARRCKGTIDIKVLTDNTQTRRKNKHMKQGLNVVVKINFIHLHSVDCNAQYAFFVHKCKPQEGPPKQNIQPNDKLPTLIANIVEKGKKSVPKMQIHIPQVEPDPPTLQKSYDILQSAITNANCTEANLSAGQKLDCGTQMLPSLQGDNIEQLNMIHLNQLVPLQNMEGIKVEMQQSLPQFTQVVVSGSQFEMPEPIFMCQPALMLDPSQVIPVSLPHHFVQVHSYNLQNNQGQL